jgi:hypothetical protein
MSRDILRQLERIRKLRYTTRGILRQRLPKGFRQSMREKVLRDVVRNRPEAKEAQNR